MNRVYPALAVLALTLLLCLAPGALSARPAEESPSAERINSAIRAATDYLIRINLPNGEFIYSPAASEKHKVPHHYNVVRHAGTMWGFVMDLDRQRRPDTLAALERSARFLFDCCMATIPDRNDLLAVWSHPSFERTAQPLQAHLGATGLALISLTGLEKQKPGSVSLDGLRRMGNFILFMQKKDGSFFEHYLLSTKQPADAKHSRYYPGEAVLGLLALYDLDPSPAWLESAIKAMEYLAEDGHTGVENTPDHWTIMATAKLLEQHGDQISKGTRERLVERSIKIARMLLPGPDDRPSPESRGSFDKLGRTTRTASSIEGLTALLSFLPETEQKLRQEVISACRNGIAFLLRAQIRSGPFAGAIPYAMRPLEEDGTEKTASFNKNASTIRIDFVQHVLGALHSYLRIMPLIEER